MRSFFRLTSSLRSLFPAPLLVPFHLRRLQKKNMFCKLFHSKSYWNSNNACYHQYVSDYGLIRSMSSD